MAASGDRRGLRGNDFLDTFLLGLNLLCSPMATTKTSKPTKAVPPAKPATASVKASPSQEPAKAKSSSGPTPEQIQVRAFEIYVSEGCKEGSDLENWLRAEKELRGK